MNFYLINKDYAFGYKNFIANFGTSFRKERHCFPTAYFKVQSTDCAELHYPWSHLSNVTNCLSAGL